MTVSEKLKDLEIPDVLCPFGNKVSTRAEFEAAKDKIKQLLMEEEYGYLPPDPESVRVEVLDKNPRFVASKATLSKLKLTATVNGEEVSFIFRTVLPKEEKPIPLFVHINFRDAIPDQYQPTEEIIDRGFGILTVCYNDVTSDDGDFENGIAGVLVKDRSNPHATGKIALWAWAVMRIIDYAVTLPYYREDALAVIGHSRLGKTALLASAFDERIKFACANNSGNSGDAISRATVGESVGQIVRKFPYWFCPSYEKYVDNEAALPFDQHFLLALSVPRSIVIGSAKDDQWADPASEFSCLTLVDRVYALYGMKGLVHTDEIPEAKSSLSKGDAHYHVRYGSHYLSREDWGEYMDFIGSKI